MPFPSASFDPLAGLEPELKMQVAKVPLQQEPRGFFFGAESDRGTRDYLGERCVFFVNHVIEVG